MTPRANSTDVGEGTVGCVTDVDMFLNLCLLRCVESAVDVHCLRTEVEDLRRVLQEIQTGGLDPPPEYTD